MATLTPGQRLAQWREKAKIQTSHAAELCHVDRSVWSRWESGDRTPKLEQAIAIEFHANLPVELWGYASGSLVMAREILLRRERAAKMETVPYSAAGTQTATLDPPHAATVRKGA